jgi:hypothetical protein
MAKRKFNPHKAISEIDEVKAHCRARLYDVFDEMEATDFRKFRQKMNRLYEGMEYEASLRYLVMSLGLIEMDLIHAEWAAKKGDSIE